jgi:ABC-type spermidine/putrescine transport system permease subunit I
MSSRTQPLAAVRGGALPGELFRGMRLPALLGPASVLWIALFLVPLSIFVVYGFFRTGVLDIEYVFSVDAYRRVLTDRIYLSAILTTIEIATAVGTGVAAVAFGFCYYVNFVFRRYRELFLTVVTIALFSGYLVRIYAWRADDPGIGRDSEQHVGVARPDRSSSVILSL